MIGDSKHYFEVSNYGSRIFVYFCYNICFDYLVFYMVYSEEELLVKQNTLDNLPLQSKVRNMNGKIKLRCTWVEALRWQEFKENPNTRGL